MLFGLFGGVTAPAVRLKIEKLNNQRADVRQMIQRGIADHSAALTELKLAISELSELAKEV